MDVEEDKTENYKSFELYEGALELLQCANAWEENVRLVGNVKASMIREICRDYARLRLEKGLTFDKIDSDKNPKK